MLRCFLYAGLRLLLVAGASNWADDGCTSQGSLDNQNVFCNFAAWQHPIQRVRTTDSYDRVRANLSAFVSLKVTIRTWSSRLTTALLRGLSRLHTLEVIGSCHDKGERPQYDLCKNVSGLDGMEARVFRATPALHTLKLKHHPLSTVSLDGLTALEVLELHLDHLRILPAALDPVRRSLREVKVVHRGSVRRGLFSRMGRLRKLELVGRLNEIEGGAIAHLPKLEHLVLDAGAPNRTIIGARALHNLTRLQKVEFRNIWRPVMPEGREPICDLGAPDVHFFEFHSGASDFLRRCPDLFSCPACDSFLPKPPIQRVLLVNVRQDVSPFLGLNAFLPRRLLNISKLQVFNCRTGSLNTELSYLPLLSDLIVWNEEPDWFYSSTDSVRHSIPKFGSLSHLIGNPFRLLPNPFLLVNVKLTINRCDCAVLDVIRWKTNHQSLQLTLDCENFYCNCTNIKDLPTYRYQVQLKWFLKITCDSRWPQLNASDFNKRNVCKGVC